MPLCDDVGSDSAASFAPTQLDRCNTFDRRVAQNSWSTATAITDADSILNANSMDIEAHRSPDLRLQQASHSSDESSPAEWTLADGAPLLYPRTGASSTFQKCSRNDHCSPICQHISAVVGHIQAGELIPYLDYGSAAQALDYLEAAMRRVLMHNDHRAPQGIVKDEGARERLLQTATMVRLSHLRAAAEAMAYEAREKAREFSVAMADEDAARALEICASVAHHLPIWEGGLVSVMLSDAAIIQDHGRVSMLKEEMAAVRAASGAEIGAALATFLPESPLQFMWLRI